MAAKKIEDGKNDSHHACGWVLLGGRGEGGNAKEADPTEGVTVIHHRPLSRGNAYFLGVTLIHA